MYAYKFSNLCGSVYRKGNVLFTPDGNSLLSPVGNRVTVFDLVNNTSYTLPFENRTNIKHMALSPNGSLLITVDEDGRALLVNFHKGVVLSHFNFKSKVRYIKFSPDGKYFASTYGHYVRVWRTPSIHKEFAPFVLLRTYGGHHDDVTHIDWSSDSKYFLATSKDFTARMYSLHPTEGYLPFTFSGHRDAVLAAFFGKNDKIIYTIGREGSIFVWKWRKLLGVKKDELKEEDGDGVEAGEEKTMDVVDGENEVKQEEGTDSEENDFRLLSGRWGRVKKQRIAHEGARARSASYSRASGILVVAFTNGVFSVYDVQEDDMAIGTEHASRVVTLHTLSISTSSLSTTTISPSGEWLAFGSAKLGQLLVWEWQSETYVLKQQGHFHDMNSIAYAPDASIIATGDDYGKVKLWNTSSGFCYVTFNEHKAPVTDLTFSPLGHSIFSSSLDGTVRAFDLVRYRNFRTFIGNETAQLSCLAIDPSGELVVAGAIDPFEVYVWSVQTGKLVDVLAAHQAPISALAFSPSQTKPLLASASWDGTVRLWEIFATGSAPEVLKHNTDVVAVAFRPDGKELAAATLDGNIHFWDIATGTFVGLIEGRNDISGGRTPDQRRTAKNAPGSKYFTCLCYSADGKLIMAGGRSKWVVMYEVSQRVRVKRYQLSRNRAIGGTVDFLDSRMLTEAGPLELIDDDDDSDREAEGRKGRVDNSLPGVTVGDMASKRSTSIEIRCKSIKFAPTGRGWAAATTEGLMIYSLDDRLMFDPIDLDIDVTPKNIRKTLEGGHYLKALIMALRLNEEELISEVYHAVPPDQIQLVASHLPDHHLQRFSSFIGKIFSDSPHVEFHLQWLTHIFTHHGAALKASRPMLASSGPSTASSSLPSLLRLLYKGISSHYSSLSKLCDENSYTLDYLSTLPSCINNKPFVDNTESADEPQAHESDEDEDEAEDNDEAKESADDGSMPAGWYNPDDDEEDEKAADEEAEDDALLPKSPPLGEGGKRKYPF